MNHWTSTRPQILSVCLLAVLVGCRSGEASNHEDEHEKEHQHEKHTQDDLASEGSDMDRTVEELLSTECEHGIKSYLCDDCRYEVGVVRVPADLLDEELLEVQPASAVSLDAPIELTGEIRVNELRTVHLSSRVEGVVTATMVDIGEKVEPSQVLFEVDSVELGESEMAFIEAKAVLAIARKNHQRQKKLLDAGITSEREYLEARQALEKATVEHAAKRKKLLLLGLSEKNIKNIHKKVKGDQFGRIESRTPLKGTVIGLHAPVGELLEPGEEVVTVSDLGSLWVWVDVYEDDLGMVIDHHSRGDLRATVEVKAWPGEEFEGVVDLVGAVMDESTRTVKARILLPNPDGRLRPGMFGQVRVYVPSEDGALAVPVQAVLSDEGREFVFVHVDDEYYVRREVKTGRRAEGFVEVLEGVESGQAVVVRGAFLLKSDVLRSKMGAGCAD